MTRVSLLPWALLVPLGLAGCGPGSDSGSAIADNVVAIYSGGEVTVQDVDALIRSGALAPNLMEQPKNEAWYGEVIRQLVAQRLLLAEAELVGTVESPEFEAVRDETRRQVVLQAFLARNPPPPEALTEEDVRAYFDAHEAEFSQEERRLVSHIFLRRHSEAAVEELRQAAAELGRRASEGESFAKLAEQHSESESRHRGGNLGWIRRGQYPVALEGVIFGLHEGEPSNPVVTPDGVHLFFVEQAVEGRRYEFSEVENLVRERVATLRAEAATEKLTSSFPLPEGSFVPEAEELAVLLRGRDPRALVVKIGDFQLNVQRFRELAAEQRSNLGTKAPSDLEVRLLDSLVRRERVFQAAGLAQDPAVERRVEALRDRDLLALYGGRGVRNRLSREPERVQQYYESNKMRFARPLQLQLTRLAIDLDPKTASRTMERLEAAHTDLGRGSLTLAGLASELGGRVEELGWVSAPELWRERSSGAGLVIHLAAGEYSAPFRTRAALEILQVVDRREPEASPFVEVMGAVQEAYLQHHQQELFDEWQKELLSDANLELVEDRLGALAGGAALTGAR